MMKYKFDPVKGTITITKDFADALQSNQFKNLTYDNMEIFIEALPNHEEYLTEFKFARYHASKLQTSGYVLVRRWFAAQFPKFRENPMFYLHNHPNLISFADIKEQVENEKRNKEKEAV